MKMHTNVLTPASLRGALIEVGLTDVEVECAEKGSRSRARAIDFSLIAEQKAGRRKRNSGYCGALRGYGATYDEHGAWFARLFEKDPEAIVGPYKGREDFHRQTAYKYAVAA